MEMNPRNEYPRPQHQREDWMCLNGEWQFEIDYGNSGIDRGLLESNLSGQIQVPFCPESVLSRVHHTDFLNAVWYRKVVDVPQEWAGKDIHLNFQAVDYDATVWVNGKEVVRHRGGSSPFMANLHEVAGETITIVVRARDFQQELKPMGKQAKEFYNSGCVYTRTTGIWQTVWLEPVPRCGLKRAKITPDLANRCFIVEQGYHQLDRKSIVRMTLLDDQGDVCCVQQDVGADAVSRLILPLAEDRIHYWEPGNGYLYKLVIELVKEGKVFDRVESYAGFRSITIDGKMVLINGKRVFQRLVLDQGYYPDGILTAPDDEALIRDIELSMAAGFNGARLHQKVFEERFLFHADRLGYLVWGEFCDWGCNAGGPFGRNQQPTSTYITQWLEVLERDYSHPSIVGWCPMNETWQVLTDEITVLDDVLRGMFLATKAMDSTRPVLDTSGYSHRLPESDIYDSHNYEQDVQKFADLFSGPVVKGKVYENRWNEQPMSIGYQGQPYFVSEFGGIWWNEDLARQTKAENDNTQSWGYGQRPADIEEFYCRFEAMCNVLLDNPEYFAYCYTQLTDVFQEMNGIFSFDRSEKFDLERLREIQTRKAAIEED
jgi:beta-galactosidase/beta-glucuronidase